MRINILSVLTLFFFIFSCSEDKNEMDETEMFFSKKYESEYFGISFKKEETKTNGKLESERQYLYVEIINSKKLNPILNKNTILENECSTIAKFIIDSVEFENIPFRPKEIQIDVRNESGNWIFEQYETKTITFNLTE